MMNIGLSDYFRAGYSALYIVTSEEERALRLIEKESGQAKREMYHWSCTSGYNINGMDADDPTQAIDIAIGELEEMSVIVLKDFHPFLQDPIIVRKLREAIAIGRATYKTFILLSPIDKLPEELKYEFTYYDFPLPTAGEHNDLVNSIAEGNELDFNGDPSFIDALRGLTSLKASDATSLSVIKTNGQFDVSIALQEKANMIKASRILEYWDQTVNFSDVGGLDLLKEWLRKRGKAFSSDAEEYGLPNPKGTLLMGPPGTGKSLIAKAIAGIWERPLLRLDMGSIRSSLQGESEANLREAIKIAEAVSPSIMWMDEIEKAVAGSESGGLDSGVGARLLSTLLTWMQEKDKAVFIVATCNNILSLRPELLSRFDNIFYCDLPNHEERKEIFRIHLEKRNRDPVKFDLELLSKQSNGYVGREIERVIESAMFDSFDIGQELEDSHILISLNNMEPLSVSMKDRIDKIRDWASKHAQPASSNKKEEQPKSSGSRLLSLNKKEGTLF